MPRLKVAVLGAGLAGANSAWALAKAGCGVTVFEAVAPASGASGNWAGAIHPHVSVDDAPLSRLSRIGLQHTQSALHELVELGLMHAQIDFAFPGHVQLFNAAQMGRWQKARAACVVDAGKQAQYAGFEWLDGQVPGFEQHCVQHPYGYYFAHGGWIKPYRWVEAALVAAKGLGVGVELGPAGQVANTHALLNLLGGFDWVVVATGAHTLPILGLPLCNPQGQTLAGVVNGQITRVARKDGHITLPKTISGACYAIDPASDNALVLGASYDRNEVESDEHATLVDAQHVAKFHTVLPHWPLGNVLGHRRSTRLNWYDRLPVVGGCGALGPKFNRVVLCTAFGSRGLTWAALAAQLVVQTVTQAKPINDEALLQKLVPRFRGVSF